MNHNHGKLTLKLIILRKLIKICFFLNPFKIYLDLEEKKKSKCEKE